MALYIDPKKAYAANPVAAKKYGIPQPTTYTPAAPQYVTPAGLATYTAAKAAGKTYVAGQGYVTSQPTEADYLKRKAEAEAVTAALRAAPTQAYVPGKGYVSYQSGLTPSYQEQLSRVQSLKTQYPWLETGEGVTAGTATTPAYKPRTETVLKTTLRDYISNPIGSFQNLFQNITQGSQGVSPIAQAQGEMPVQATRPGGVQTLSKEDMLKAIESTPGRSAQTEISYGAQTNKNYYQESPMTSMEAKYLDTYLDTGTQTEQGDVAMQRVIEGVKNNVVTPQNITPKNELAINQELVRHGVMPQFYENQQDTNLAAFADKLGRDAVNVPISPERLDAVQDEASLATLWNTGYKAPKVISGMIDLFGQFQSATNIPLWGVEDPEKLKSIDYTSLVKAAEAISSENLSDTEIQKMLTNGTTMRLETTRTNKFDSFGNPIYTASWAKDVPVQPPKKSDAQTEADYWTNWQTDVDHYWDSREVTDRNARREESWEWSNNKSLEGWAEYYATLDSLKMAPFMNEWASSTAMFNELRQKWQTIGGGQSWTDFLNGYDFFSKWFEQRPEARGEKPTAFAPILQGVSKL